MTLIGFLISTQLIGQGNLDLPALGGNSQVLPERAKITGIPAYRVWRRSKARPDNILHPWRTAVRGALG